MSWISGACSDDDKPAAFVVYEDRPDGSTDTTVLHDGQAFRWVDSGSGPGFLVPLPDDDGEV